MAITAKEQLAEYLRGTGENGADFALAAMTLVDQLIETNDDPGDNEQWSTGLTRSQVKAIKRVRTLAEGKHDSGKIKLR